MCLRFEFGSVFFIFENKVKFVVPYCARHPRASACKNKTLMPARFSRRRIRSRSCGEWRTMQAAHGGRGMPRQGGGFPALPSTSAVSWVMRSWMRPSRMVARLWSRQFTEGSRQLMGLNIDPESVQPSAPERAVVKDPSMSCCWVWE